jgi:predicted nucleic acid-binding protein
MPSSSTLGVDASLVVRFVTNAPDAAIKARWRIWHEIGQDFVAPNLLCYEVVNTLHRLTRAGEIPAQGAQTALDTAFRLPIQFHHDLDLHWQALAIAGRLTLPAAYDVHYLALAEREGIEFWTADRRLANAIRPHLSWVQFGGTEPSMADGSL